MKLISHSFADAQKIPDEFAFGIVDPAHHVGLGQNRNPHLSWSDVPENTRSFALLCHDPDAPSVGDDVNQEGRAVPVSLPRVDFFHWLLVDLPASLREIQAGEFSSTVTPKGKPGPQAPHDARQGVNDYTAWFSSDNDMRGDYYGYDGPCPPWNDELPHRYVFTLYALDVARLPLEGRFDGPALRAALQGHVLAEARLTGVYSLNPSLA
ncbi:MAG: YbhB/YbcL family Raf kinase inhibitor-like protein [Zoogloeaceae bacterium]|jgi:Raf kinase inhibitor-like YbhB/YbcL family protein|nr:YbhB/YbcL family Raf kinase inhibitor-like protein [Zoogloeaceae bacterium]